MAFVRRFAVPLALALALAAPAAAKPRLTVEPGAGVSQIFVEVDAGNDQVRRSLLRVTPAPVVPGATGADPAGRAAFATWTENGERWFSASQDGGRTWAAARAIDTALHLHAGAVEPGRPTKAVP